MLVVIFSLLAIGFLLGAVFIAIFVLALIAAAVMRVIIKIVAKVAPSPGMERRVADFDAHWSKLGAQLRRGRN